MKKLLDKKSHPYKEIFIVFEGIDGSGKSTQAKMFYDFLKLNNFKVILTAEPTDGKIGKKIRKILSGKIKVSAKKLQEMFILDRLDHLKKVIIPALKKRYVVVCDRYYFSTVAYGQSDEISKSWLLKKHKEILGDKFIKPEITFILDVLPEVAWHRKVAAIGDKSKMERFEKLEYMKKIAKNYKELAKQKRKDEYVFLIDNNKNPEVAHKEIVKIFSEYYSLSLYYS